MSETKKTPLCPNITTPKKRRANVLRRYINRIYAICLLNTIAAIILAIVYTETRNEAAFTAMTICEANALMTWMSAS